MLAPAVERDRAPQIFSAEYYQRLYELEERHWWSIGMRAIATGLLARRLNGSSGLRVLDAGCGTGAALTWLSDLSSRPKTVGIDYSLDALEYCRRRPGRRLAQASVTDLPFPGQTFDLVTCADVIQHLPRDGSDQIALREFHRILRPGGVLFVRTNVRLAESRSASRALASAEADPNYHQYSRDEVTGMLAAAGFVVETASYANMLPALVSTWLGRLRSKRVVTGRPGRNPGLRMCVPPGWLNSALQRVMIAEAWYLARCHGVLPYGHSLICLAVKPGRSTETRR